MKITCSLFSLCLIVACAHTDTKLSSYVDQPVSQARPATQVRLAAQAQPQTQAKPVAKVQPPPEARPQSQVQPAAQVQAAARPQPAGKEAKSDGIGDLEKEYEKEYTAIRPSMSDPLWVWNVAWFHFNDKLYFWFVKPISIGWRYLFYPRFMRVGLHDFFVNLGFFGRFFNSAFQGHPIDSGSEFARFVINLTVGVAGFWDPATKLFHLQRYDRDFDQTLGVWGIGMGPYFMFPLLGPSSVRGFFGLIGDEAFDPAFNYSGVIALRRINDTSLDLNEYETILHMALDRYTAVRDAYIENRKFKVAEH